MSEDERQPLLSRDSTDSDHDLSPNSLSSLICFHRRAVLATSVVTVWIIIALSLVLCFLVLPASSPIPADQSTVRLMSLSVWGSPASFGVRDKEERMAAIGEYIRDHSSSLDIVILQELWMRPDHSTIESLLNGTGFRMTYVGDLASPICDGRIAPTYCSGLALITKLPIVRISFGPYSVSGDFWWNDGEYYARKGTGRITLAPAKNVTLDIFLTSLAAYDYNNWYRQRQAQEFGQAMRASDADYVIAAGNMEVDPRTSETTYSDIKRGMKDSRHEYLQTSWLDPGLATYGNTKNTYSGREGPLVFDYLFHKSQSSRSMSVTNYRVNVLKTKSGKSFSNHEAVEATYSLH